MICRTVRINPGKFLAQLGWWVFTFICTLYAVFAFYMAAFEILAQLGLAEGPPHRATPLMFIVHALTGGMVLIGIPFQFNRWIRNRYRKAHRIIGRIYVAAILVSSAAALWAVVFFDVGRVAKMVFGVLGVLWFLFTAVAMLRVLQREFTQHREWMIRSASLSLFFITFSLWVPLLQNTNLPLTVAYPLGIFLSWSLNLLLAEQWIRHSRPRSQGRDLPPLDPPAQAGQATFKP